ncbi:MAG TPA: 2'-5' RNA ligase family protein [Streptosporangiaceae bacterium]
MTDLAMDCQGKMANLPGLDLIPREWLHLTVQGIGFTDEIPAADLGALTSASRKRLAALEPVTVALGPVFVHDEAVVLPAKPATALTPVRDHLREAVASVLGPGRVRDGDGWVPHVSVAYSDGTGSATRIIEALRPRFAPRTVTITELTLISQERAGHCYRWETVTILPLGTP